jgi:hypothetical protein
MSWDSFPPVTEPLTFDEAESAGVDGTLRNVDAQPAATCQRCDHLVEWGYPTDVCFKAFFHVVNNQTECPNPQQKETHQ